MDWNKEAAQIVKAAKARHGKEWRDISEALETELGVKLSADTLSNRVNKGAFSFVLALQILSVLGVTEVEIPKVDRNSQ